MNVYTRSFLWIVAAALLASICAVTFVAPDALHHLMAIAPIALPLGLPMGMARPSAVAIDNGAFFNAARDPSASDALRDADAVDLTYEELDRRIRQHNTLRDNIRADASRDDRELTERELTRLDALEESLAIYQSEIETRTEANESRAVVDGRQQGRTSAQAGMRKTEPNATPGRQTPASTAAASRNGVIFAAGTREFSAQLFGVAPSAAVNDSRIKPEEYFAALATRTFDPRLVNNATATEGIGVDGGFDVPTLWYFGAIDQALQTSEFAQRCRIFPASSNAMTIPMLDTSNRSAGVAGLLANWASENDAQTPQAMKWKAVEMKLKKTFILSEASSELVEDGISYESQLTGGMSLATAQTLDAAILYGTGIGQPLGIVNSAGAIQIAAEGGQAADSIVWLNLVKMYSRLAPAAQKRATWFVSPQVLPSLMAVKVPDTDSPALLSGGFNDAAAGTPAMSIFGRPVVVTEIAGQLGDQGDIVFADMSQYGLLVKRGARMENSNAPGFNRDVISFRMIMRVDGVPLWPTPIIPFNGGTTLTWATYLAPR